MSKNHLYRYKIRFVTLSIALLGISYPKHVSAKTVEAAAPKFRLLSKTADFSLFVFDEKIEDKHRWAIVLENFTPEDQPYIEVKRILQLGESTDKQYLPLTVVLDEEKAPAIKTQLLPELTPISIGPWGEIHLEKANEALGEHPAIIMTEKGFLPGEGVHIRVLKNGTFREIRFTPIPLMLKDPKGNFLGFANLLSINPTSYQINLFSDKNNPIWRVQDNRSNICKVYDQDPPTFIEVFPEIANKKGGINHFICTYRNGSSSAVYLPWGESLRPYIYENELNPYLKKQECIKKTITSSKNRIDFSPYFSEQEIDDGFNKWRLVLQDFKSNAEAPIIEVQRLLFSPHFRNQFSSGIAEKKTERDDLPPLSFYKDAKPLETGIWNGEGENASDKPRVLIIRPQGFLPGEKATCRVRHKNDPEGETISFCPYPLIFRDGKGGELAHAELINLKPAIYDITINFNEGNKIKKLEVISYRKKEEVLLHPKGVVHYKAIGPYAAKSQNGTFILTLSYENGDSFNYELPWGEQFAPYLLGQVKQRP